MPEKLQHAGHASDGGDRVRDALALNVGRRPVAGLANGESIAHIGARHHAQTAHQRRRAVREDVAVQVRRHDDVVVARLAEQLVHHAVYNLLLGRDGAVPRLAQHLEAHASEQAVRLRQHVALVRDRDLGLRVHDLAGREEARVAHALPPQRNVARHGGDAAARLGGDALDRLADLGVALAGRLLLLDVQVLGVFAHDDQVDGVQGVGADGLDGADVGVEAHLLAQGDDWGGVAGGGLGGRGDGAEEGAVALLLERLDGRVGQGGAGSFEVVEAGGEVDEGAGEAEGGGEGFEQLAAGRDDLWWTLLGCHARV